MTTLKYKVGDRLKVKDEFKDRCASCFQHTGWIEITSIVSNLYKYVAYNKDGVKYNNCVHCYKDEHIEGYYNPVDTKKSHTFKVGDRVRIRQWDDMAKEFGVDIDGDIRMPSGYFMRIIKHLCGREATIACFLSKNLIELTDWSNSTNTNWDCVIDMIEPVDPIFDTSKDLSDSFAYAVLTMKQSKWTPEPAKYHNGSNWFTKSTVCIDGKEMTVEEFKAKTTLYRSALAAYNNYFPTK